MAGVQLRPIARARAAVRPARADRLVVRAADDEGFEVPDFVKDLMKPPDASVAAPGWLEPLINLAEEAGESATLVGYGIAGATGVFFMLIFAILGLGPLGFLIGIGGTGYACWQAGPYLQAITSKFDAVPPPAPPAPEEDEE